MNCSISLFWMLLSLLTHLLLLFWTLLYFFKCFVNITWLNQFFEVFRATFFADFLILLPIGVLAVLLSIEGADLIMVLHIVSSVLSKELKIPPIPLPFWNKTPLWYGSTAFILSYNCLYNCGSNTNVHYFDWWISNHK